MEHRVWMEPRNDFHGAFWYAFLRAILVEEIFVERFDFLLHLFKEYGSDNYGMEYEQNRRQTKEITAVKVVWKCDCNCLKLLSTFALNFSDKY